jgi:hypothetical protein
MRGENGNPLIPRGIRIAAGSGFLARPPVNALLEAMSTLLTHNVILQTWSCWRGTQCVK